jgi:flagellar biosynthesis component FlhA
MNHLSHHFTYTLGLIIYHWMIVYKSFCCFTRYIGKCSITNISCTRHGKTEKLVSFVTLQWLFSILLLLLLSLFFFTMIVVSGTHIFFFFLFGLPLVENVMLMIKQKENKKKRKKKKNSFR